MAIAKNRELVPVDVTPPVINAAAYLRMSTDNQRYSIHNQLEVIQEYATEHGIQVVQTYADKGIAASLSKNALACAAWSQM